MQTLRPALSVFALLTALTGVAYPLAVTGIAQAAFPHAANGSVLSVDGKAVGSALIGQSFSAPKYFGGRPSATSPMPNNGVASSGSNLGANNPALIDAARDRVATLRRADPGNTLPVPVDLVTTSGSGLDPEISLAAALYQAQRVARARSVDETTVRALIEKQAQRPWLGVIGEPRVNVLLLNLALDGKTVDASR
ncbi:MAG: potassium-transporting ATPase subunit KdpC [Burkholderiaceae bacterium]